VRTRSMEQYSIRTKFRERKNTYIAASQATLERGSGIAWLCIQTIRINIAFFSTS
jgi:hypothetical protein